MKKIILFGAILLGITSAQAQSNDHVYGTQATDNWSFTLKGGAATPFQHFSVFKNARGIFGAELRKQVTPVLGLGVEGEWTINTSSWIDARTPSWGVHSATMIDHQMVGAFATFNLSNLFGGYKGTPRCIEFEGIAGAGWLHGYKHATSADMNSWYTKYGMNINFNLCESKAWTISLKPAVLWDMNDVNQYSEVGKQYSDVIAHGLQAGASNRQQTRYNANRAMLEVEVGLTYHFGNSNGLHYMTLCPYKYTQSDIDALNNQINELRNRKPEVIEKVVEKPVEKIVEKIVEKPGRDLGSLESTVFFKIGKWDITRDQMPNVERVAHYMKRNPKATVNIEGFASKDGPKELNLKLARNRANAVKNCLINKYGIKASRISAAGKGITEMFSELEWNRVAISVINKNN